MACGRVRPAIKAQRDRAAYREAITIAIIYNQATLTYSGGIRNSNITQSELSDSLTAVKTAISASYAPNEDVTYALSIVNTSDAALTGLTVTDDLGGYAFDAGSVYPLAYVQGSMKLFIDGALQAAPTVNAGPPLTVTGLNVPAGGNALLIYEANVTEYAPLGTAAEITNTATVGGAGSAVTAQATVPLAQEPELTIEKAVEPLVVTAGGELTYTFTIRNYGSVAADAADAVVVHDAFSPILQGLSAELDGAPLSVTTDYTYDEATGEFATAAGRITVPAAAFAQSDDGTWSITPGETILVVSGTV